MTSSSHTPQATLLGHYAGFVSRLIAFGIDLAVLSVVVISVSWFVSTSMKMLQFRAIIERIIDPYPVLQMIEAFFFSPTFYSLVTLTFIVAYYIFFWTIAGQTIGKAIMGIKIVNRRGKKLKLHQAILRYLGYYLSAVPFGFGFLWILLDDRRMAWHDKIAGTCVVYTWDARPDELFLTGAMNALIARREALKAFIASRKNKNT